MTDDRSVSQEKQRLGDQRSQRRQGKPENLLIGRMSPKWPWPVRTTQPRKHGAVDATVGWKDTRSRLTF